VPELAPLESAMTNFLAAHQFEAGTLALMQGSKLVLRQGYGSRDSALTTLIHPDNLFRLASVSKMLTESAIYKLVDAAKITTNTLVYSYLGIPPWGGTLGDSRINTITVQNLLDHKGGWDETISPVGDPVFSTIKISTEMGLDYPAAPTNVISWMFSKPLDHAPGTTYAYSNLGYQILGRVIEKASGKSYLNYIQQDLLGNAVITNALGFTNFVQSRSRPTDLASWEIWYGEPTPFLESSAVDYPTNLLVRDVDGGLYYESFDSFGGMSASAIGLCHYLLNYWEGGHLRHAGVNYGWNYTFFGSLPGASSVLYQNITQTSTSTNGLEFAALFNERDGATPGQDNSAALTAITAATASITSWPSNGGGMIQWSTPATNVNKNAGSVTVSLLRSGASTLPVKVSYTTYALTAGSSNYKTTSGIVSFAAGVTRQTVTVPILNDGLIDPTLRFSLELISASGGAWLGNQLSSVVSILDTNTPPKFTGQPIIQPNGNVQFQFMSSPGVALTLEYTTDLSNWQPLQTFTNTAVVNSFTDTNSSSRIQTFYRLVVP
jgi:CubicO group peptidase (beta-lactamase class C family)